VVLRSAACIPISSKPVSRWPTTRELSSSWLESTASSPATFYRSGYCRTAFVPVLSCITASSFSAVAKVEPFVMSVLSQLEKGLEILARPNFGRFLMSRDSVTLFGVLTLGPATGRVSRLRLEGLACPKVDL